MRAFSAPKAPNAKKRKLILIGDGAERKALEALAKGHDNISFLRRQSNEAVARLLQEARALIFPGEEDFGIVPLEAMAAGRPVLAYGRGGALETVKDGRTGLFFDEQTPESLNAAIDRLEANYADFDPQAISDWAKSFDVGIFERKLAEGIEAAYRAQHAPGADYHPLFAGAAT